MDKLPVTPICIHCFSTLSHQDNNYTCPACKMEYPIKDGIPLFFKKNSSLDTKMQYIDHYQKDAEAFDYFTVEDPQKRHDDKRLHQSIIKNIRKKDNIILDIGSGNGWLAKALVPLKKHVFAADISYKNIAGINNNLKSTYFHGFVADVFDLPFREQSFDCIVASEVIEHTVNPQLFIQTLKKYVKPGGRIIISTPYKEKIIYSLCIHCNKLTPQHAHLHSFDKEKIITLLHNAGIKENIKISTRLNKLLSFIRSYKILNIFPYGLWKFTDCLFNNIIRKPAKMIIRMDEDLTKQ